jgi:hypothetical protein
MDAKGAQMTYLKRSRVRLLEVTVTAQPPTLWKWHISEHDLEIMHGHETSRETAQIKGNNALFKLLTEHGSHGVPRRGH